MELLIILNFLVWLLLTDLLHSVIQRILLPLKPPRLPKPREVLQKRLRRLLSDQRLRRPRPDLLQLLMEVMNSRRPMTEELRPNLAEVVEDQLLLVENAAEVVAVEEVTVAVEAVVTCREEVDAAEEPVREKVDAADTRENHVKMLTQWTEKMELDVEREALKRVDTEKETGELTREPLMPLKGTRLPMQMTRRK